MAGSLRRAENPTARSSNMSSLRKHIAYSIFAPALLLAGSASAPSAEVQAKRVEFERTIPVCDGEADCKAKWEAAQLWVVHNAGFKVQTATDVLIETYNPGPSDATIATRVTKEPLGGGRYKLVVYVWCNNIFGCVPNAWDAAINFNSKIAGATP